MKKSAILASVAAVSAAAAFAECQTAGETCCRPGRPCTPCAPKICDQTSIDPVIGNWGAKLPYDSMYASSLIFSRTEEGEPKAFVLYRWGSPEWCLDVKVEGDSFSFRHPYGVLMRGKVKGCKLEGEIAPCDKDGKANGDYKPFSGWRIAPVCQLANVKNAKFGEPVDLLKDGLDGWKAMSKGGVFGWKFKDGVLSNALGRKPDGKWKGGGVNLVTRRDDFGDFNLEYDVRVPEGSNSGVYLRGRFECQVIDSYKKPVNRHNMAAYYGRVTPITAAEKAPGEWQHVSVTIYKRRLTVVLNGVTIIENAEVTGVTGGAIDADVDAKGPIYLQGDHSDADFKNMILRPAI
ncbi:MAG: DUF1080 domain-containing protein [Kiritimatiellae bacterium]|nr:DUF1080 domain-containing protein [Kiritimatiellia bacterium]